MAYLIQNLRSRRTTLALVGVGIHLAPKNEPGDTAYILDAEIEEDDVKAKVAAGIIVLRKLTEPVHVDRSAAATQRERARVESRKRTEARRAERRAAAQNKSTPVAAPELPPPSPPTLAHPNHEEWPSFKATEE